MLVLLINWYIIAALLSSLTYYQLSIISFNATHHVLHCTSSWGEWHINCHPSELMNTNIIRQLLRKCVICQKVIAKPYQAPDLPPLIAGRTYVGTTTLSRYRSIVDFPGAFYVDTVYACSLVLLQGQYSY